MAHNVLFDIIPGSVTDRIVGMIYGHALGDAVGLCSEFKFKKDAPLIQYPYAESIRGFPVCDWTDDTDHLILAMRSICDNYDENHDVNINQKDFAKKLKDWVSNGFKELGDTHGLGLGGTTNEVINKAIFLENPSAAANEVWHASGKKLAPNGSLMRTSILGAINDITNAEQCAVDLCKITHVDPRCIASCVMQTCILNQIIYKTPARAIDVQNILAKCIVISRKYIDDVTPINFDGLRHQPTPQSYHDKTFKSREEEFSYWIQVAFTEDISQLKLDEMVKIGFVLKCLGCSVYALQVIKVALQSGRTPSFEKFILKIAGECGDADTNAAVSGAVMGAFVGYTNLPAHWIEGLPNKKWLDQEIMKFMKVLTRC